MSKVIKVAKTSGADRFFALAESSLLTTLEAQPGGVDAAATKMKRVSPVDVDGFEASATISARGKRAQLGLRLFYEATPRVGTLARRAGTQIDENVHDFFCEIANQVVGQLKRGVSVVEEPLAISLPMTTIWGAEKFSVMSAGAERPLAERLWLCDCPPARLRFGFQAMLDCEPSALDRLASAPKLDDDLGDVTFF